MDISEIAKQFKQAAVEIRNLIKASKYKVRYFIVGMGFSSNSAFYKRLRDASWTPEELLKLGQLLEGN